MAYGWTNRFETWSHSGEWPRVVNIGFEQYAQELESIELNGRDQLQVLPVFGLSVVILALDGCATEKMRPPVVAVTRERFRELFPLDERLTDAVLRDYASTQETLLDKSKNGARSNVALLTADGRIHSGYDEFFSAGENSLREVRDNYVAIQIGTTLCTQGSTEKTTCKRSKPLKPGLAEIEKWHVSQVWSIDTVCSSEATPCRFIKIQTGSAESDFNSSEGFSTEPELVGHDYELLFTMPAHVPIYYKQTDHMHVGITATAFYLFQFDLPVNKIELPQDNQSTQRD